MFASSTSMRDKLLAPNQYSANARSAFALSQPSACAQYARASSISSAHFNNRVVTCVASRADSITPSFGNAEADSCRRAEQEPQRVDEQPPRGSREDSL